MKHVLAIISAFAVAAHGQTVALVAPNDAASYPFERVVAVATNPAVAQEGAWLLSVPVPSLVDLGTHEHAPVVSTVAHAQEALAARIAAHRRERTEQTLDAAWPILTAHPSTNDVPPAGITYRLDEGEGVVTWWVARQGDLIATQLSAHDRQGRPVVNTVSLRTRTTNTLHLSRLTTVNTQAVATAQSVAATSASANSVPALRAEVARLAQVVAQLEQKRASLGVAP